MIPVRLELRNFMSYGEQVTPLDFSGMHIACLSGDNGNGKSALLDAITWALWGEARASADELIRLGADEMSVIFDFQLGEDLYRVIRNRSKRTSGNSWEVYIAQSDRSDTSDTSDWRPLTGQGIRDTGRIIQRILRMDYKTFINSAYIQQGRADEFTKQTVSDRKKILADILDLSRYDALEQKAKQRRNESEQQVQELEQDISRIEAELANEESYRENLTKSKDERQALEARITEVEGELRQLQARKAELDVQANRVKEIEQQIAGWRSEVKNLRIQQADQERRVNRAREIVKDKERILESLAKLESAREQVTVFNRRLEELRALEHEKAGLEQQIKGEQHKLELEKQSLAKELSELESRLAEASKIEVKPIREQVKVLDELDNQRSRLQAQATSASDKWTDLKGQYERMLQIKEDLEVKVKMLGESDECPLCKTELSHEKHEAILKDYKFEIERTDEEVRNLRAAGSEAKAKRDAAQQEIARIDQQLKDGLDVRKRLAQMEQLLSQAEESRKRASEIKPKLDALEASLSSGDFAIETGLKLKEVEGWIAGLGYDESTHKRLKDELAELGQYQSLALSLKHAEENLPADESSLKAITKLISARERSIAESTESAGKLSRTIGELPSVVSQISSVTDSLQSLRASDREITGRIATLEQSLRQCKSLSADMKAKRKSLEQGKKDQAAYAELVAAFGKKGVQALIIENAIPEIQEEANRLLARMTDNAMQVSIETVRDKKTGGIAETLDIRISDDMGTRAYELFSGGEAFRINFALRIALSKLLARRAGARLQTLIIDEGFGTQDGKGREKLVEAIDSIRDDFEKILVITHIDELKDAFPTRIEITKDSHGSQICVN